MDSSVLCSLIFSISSETTEFNKTSLEASLGDLLQKYNKALKFNNNKMADYCFSFENISKTTRPNSIKL